MESFGSGVVYSQATRFVFCCFPNEAAVPMRALVFLLILASVLVVTATEAVAQTPGRVTGQVVDATSGDPLPTANVLATRLASDSLQTGVAADLEGRFVLPLASGTYRLRISFAGYQPDLRTIAVGDTLVALGEVALRPGELSDIEVTALRPRVEVRGDTTAYNAEAYQVNPDASVEDLVSKLPGVIVQDGQVQARGETVRRVLVDGEEFFGDDPTTALRNLPAEIVQEIQVFERQSDQAQFTGFDDGNAEVTLNVVTRPDRRVGQFGRLFGSGGTDTRYSAGGAVHAFQGARRISLIGLTNNINEQNFAAEDLLGVISAASGRRGGGGFRGGGGGGFRGGGGFGGGRASAGTYLVGEQAGVTHTTALGVNYTDRFGSNVRVQGSYFLNRAGNDTDALTERDYLIGEALLYSETNNAGSTNWNHRFSGRIEATLSEATQLTLTPRLSVQTHEAQSLLVSQSLIEDVLAGFSRNDYAATNRGYTANTNLFLRHRFPTRGRTLSLGVQLGLNGRTSATDQDVLALSYDAAAFEETFADTTEAYQRQIDGESGSRDVSASLSYTEPLGERVQLQLSYDPSLSTSSDDRDAFRLDPETGGFSIIDSTFTSLSDQRVVRQRGGVGVRYNTERLRLSASLDAEVERLDYDQGGPRPFAVDRNTTALLPSVNARLELTEDADLNLRYRSSTRTPGVTQLRDVIDDTNPLLITAGNPDLQTSREHRLDLRFRRTQPGTASVLFGSVQLTATRDYIGTAVVLADGAARSVQGITLEPGAQFSYPVNLDGYYRARAFGTVGRPLFFLQSNANATLGMTYTRTPSLYNDVQNRADALALDGRLFLGTGFSERFDASLSYGVSWTGVSNTRRTTRDDTYFRHRANARLTWQPRGGWVVSTDFNLSAFTGLDTDVSPTTAAWNAGFGYKFMPGDLAEVRLSVNDLLNQNAPVGQNVTDTYIETSQSQALGRYVMLTLSYQLRAFGSGAASDEDDRRPRGRSPGPPSDRRPPEERPPPDER